VVSWIDFETIVFLFGMMTLIGVFSETGFFEWSAIQAYKLSGGNIWTLVLILVPPPNRHHHHHHHHHQ